MGAGTSSIESVANQFRSWMGLSNAEPRLGQHAGLLKGITEPEVKEYIEYCCHDLMPLGSEEIDERLLISRVPNDWSSCPAHVQNRLISKHSCKELIQLKTDIFRDVIDNDGFHHFRAEIRPREAVLTSLHFVTLDGILECKGYDTITSTWCTLPPFNMLPRLDEDVFQAHSICGAGGMLCANVGKLQDKLITFNPLARSWKELPRLNHPRSPVLMHMIFNQEDNSYKVIVAGSSRLDEGHLSKITEVFDSRTWVWKVTGDLPGPQFGLNDYQTGVYSDGILYCIAFLGDGEGKGIIAYNIEEEKWLVDRTCLLPNYNSSNIMQLVESKGQVYLFSELERHDDEQDDPCIVHRVEHRIDVLIPEEMNLHSRKAWRNVITDTKVGYVGLQLYPEYTCVPLGEGKLCVFNSIEHVGIVYDIENEKRCESTLQPPTRFGSEDMVFYSLNPLTFNFEPSFKTNP